MRKIIQDKEVKRYALVDAETENLCLHEIQNKAWQISLLIAENSTIIKKHNFYIKWPEGLNVSKEAAAITRFDPSIIEEKGVSPEEVLPILDFELNECDYVVGHNALNFDCYILMGFYRKLGRKPFNIYPKAIDTLALARGWKLEQMPKRGEDFTAWQLRMLHKRTKGLKCSLGALGKEFEIEHPYHLLHDALVDLELNFKVFNKLKKFFTI